MPNEELGDFILKKWERFSRQEIDEFVKTSRSYAELASKLGYNSASGSYSKTMKDMIDKLDLDISHFTFQGWNKNNFDYSRFVYGKKIKSIDMIDAISALRGRTCECCGLSEWMGGLIPLEVHHKDGDELNSTLENLQLLCPNCHAMTDTYKGKNIKNKDKAISEEDFVQALCDASNIRQALIMLGLTAKGRNYMRANELIIKYQINKYYS